MWNTTRFIAAGLASVLLTAACSSGPEAPGRVPPSPSGDALAEADAIFRACLAEFDIEPKMLEMDGGGIANIRFPLSTPQEKVEAAMFECEPLVAEALGAEPPSRDDVDAPRVEAATDAEISRYVAGLRPPSFNGYLVAVRGGQVVVDEGVGRLGPRMGVPTATSAFDIASISKTFTAAAICALEAQGKLSRSDTLADLLSSVPDDKEDITVAQLLAFEGGFHEYLDRGDFEMLTRREAMERAFRQDLRFEPGTTSAYSNTEYTLLAAIVQKVSGVPFTDFIRRRLLGPAGLRDTGFYGDELWERDDAAVGAGRDTFEGNRIVDFPRASWALLGAGGMISTARDLAAWVTALHRGKVLDEVGLRCRAEVVPSLEFDGLTIHGYAGGNDYGFNSFVLEAPAEATFLVALDSSSGSARANAEAVGTELGNKLLGISLPSP